MSDWSAFFYSINKKNTGLLCVYLVTIYLHFGFKTSKNILNYPQCSSDECQGNGISHQSRTVQCIDATNSIVVNETECLDTGSQPVSLRNCYTINCSAIWNTSDWTQVIYS